ncbi:MAG: PDZ domain-containing protein [bacterium]|nr:PDZ domain-containing protein [bacterium]
MLNRALTTILIAITVLMVMMSAAMVSGETVAKAQSTDKGWLGVRISPVPSALAAHLKTKGAGVLVSNLIKGSPAHTAGIKQYDVIVGLDDNAIASGPALLKALSGLKSGDKVKLSVIQNGEKTQIPIELGKPVPAAEAEHVYKDNAPGLMNVEKDVMRLHPHVVLRKKAGDWEKMEGKDLPKDIREMLKMIPKGMGPGANAGFSVSSKTVIHTKDSDGSDVRIEQDETGITVTRKQVDDDGNEAAETKTYKDREELRLSDPEAFDLLKNSRVNIFTAIKPGEIGKLMGGKMPKVRVFPGGGAAELDKEMRETILKNLENMNLPDNIKKQIAEQLQKQLKPKADAGETAGDVGEAGDADDAGDTTENETDE